jgi:anthranilate synthase component 1
MTAEGGAIRFRAGAGIVADSNAAAELAETRAKAKGLLRALEAP